MKALIQHNFTSGLGDMYCDMSEYMTTALQLKKLGYEINLIFCLANNRYSKENVFFKIFNEETISFFTNVEETFSPIREKKYKDYNYFFTSHEYSSPGFHRWDLFLDQNPEEPLEVVRYSIDYFVQGILPKVKPEFSKEIYKRVEDFESKNGKLYSFLHLRVSDIKRELEDYLRTSVKIDSFIKDKKLKFYLGTNNDLMFDYFKGRENIIRYDFASFPKLGKDVNEIDNYSYEESFFDRMCDIIAEMILIKNSDSIYFHSDIERLSNFYAYAYLKNSEIKFINIKEILNSE